MADQRLLAAIVNSSEDAILSKSLAGEILSWNTGAEKIFGYRAAEAIGKNIRLIVPEDKAGEEEKIVGQIRKGIPVEHFETIRVAKDGRRLDISVTVSPLYDNDGNIIGASKIARDITLQKKAVAERDHYMQELELTNEKLSASNK